MEEANEVILKAWSKERFSHQGKFWKFEKIALYPRPVQQPHPPISVAGTSLQTLGWAGRQGYDIMTVGHPHPPDKVRHGVEAWREGLRISGFDPVKPRCQFHIRTWVDENAKHADEVATEAIRRYDAISRIGRKEDQPVEKTYDWEGMLASGRNLYGNPDQCIQIINNSMKHYSFNILTTTFNFGGIPHDMIKKRCGYLPKKSCRCSVERWQLGLPHANLSCFLTRAETLPETSAHPYESTHNSISTIPLHRNFSPCLVYYSCS
jgi:alkanesulfonate monooxygenase SsuD/methylene tetrahydromethanopterin reductase-like flavin-dependent oxidoreductase (luciferase family)